MMNDDYHIQKLSLKKLLADFENIWTAGQVKAYKSYLTYLLSKNIYREEDKFTTLLSPMLPHTIVLYPEGGVISLFQESWDLTPILQNPPSVTLLVDETNTIITPYIEPKNVIEVKFPFCISTPNYIESMPTSKKRYRWKQILQDEAQDGEIYIRLEEQTPEFDAFVMSQLSKFRENPVYAMGYLKLLRNYVGEKWIFSIYQNGKRIGVKALVTGGSWGDQNVYPSLIFTSIKPCAYSLTKILAEGIFQEGEIFHGGAAVSLFSEDWTRIFSYKFMVSNATRFVPYFAIIEEDQGFHPPFYSVKDNKWVREKRGLHGE